GTRTEPLPSGLGRAPGPQAATVTRRGLHGWVGPSGTPGPRVAPTARADVGLWQTCASGKRARQRRAEGGRVRAPGVSRETSRRIRGQDGDSIVQRFGSGASP